MNLRSKSGIIKSILDDCSVSAALFFRPEELVMSLGYYPILGRSFCLYPQQGQAILYIPEGEPQDHIPSNIDVKVYAHGRDSQDIWKNLRCDIQHDLVRLNIENLPLTFIEDYGQSALAAYHGEALPITRQIICDLVGDFKDISKEFLPLFAQKTSEDIKALEKLHEVTKQATQIFMDHVQPGISEAELSGRVYLELKKLQDDENYWHIESWCYIQAGKNTIKSGQYSLSSAYKLKEGDAVLMELAICVNGYWSDITRSHYVGKEPPTNYEKIYKIIKTAQQMAVDGIRPGVLASDIDEIARNYIHEKGYGAEFTHALGHQVGFRYHDPGITLSPSEQGIITEGMILTVEPGIYSQSHGFGIRIEDNILVTSNGAKVLSK